MNDYIFQIISNIRHSELIFDKYLKKNINIKPLERSKRMFSNNYRNVHSIYNGHSCTWSFINFEYKQEGKFLKFVMDNNLTKIYFWIQKYGNLNIPFDVDPISDPENRVHKIVGYWDVIASPINHYNYYSRNGIIRSSSNWTIGNPIPEVFKQLFEEEKDHISIFVS